MAYLHLGSDVTVHMGDVIGIFDMERVTVNSPADKFLRDSQKTGRIYYVSLDLPKSFVVTAADESELVFVSNVATLTLRKRCGILKY